jgi:hypothetical protein
MCGYSGTRQISLAACIEFIHTATLLHDDVVDESDLRRGSATANAVWGNKPSVLVGDFLFSRAFQLSVADGSLKVLAILANTSAVLAEGEVMQLMTSNDTETSEAAYLDVITSKTATLFAAACQFGAIVAERPAVEEEGRRAGAGRFRTCGGINGTSRRYSRYIGAGSALRRHGARFACHIPRWRGQGFVARRRRFLHPPRPLSRRLG